MTTAGEVPAADPKTTTSRKVRFAAEIDRRLLVALHGVSLAVLGVVLLRLADASIPWIDHLPLPWWVIAASFFVVEATALHIEIRRETHTLSLSGIPLLLGLLSLPPLALLLARLAGNGLALMVVRRRFGLKLAWNLALYTLETAAAALIASFALAGGRPSTLSAWIGLLAAVLVADLIGLISVPVVIMIAEGRIRFSLLSQVGRSQLLAAASSSFAAVTAAAMLELPWLAVFAFGPLIAVALLFRLLGRVGKEHDDLQQLHSFTTAIAGRDSLDTGLAQLAVILRASAAMLAVRSDDDTFSVRIHPDHTVCDDEVVVAVAASIAAVTPDVVVTISPGSAPSEPKSILHAVGGQRGLAMPIDAHTGGRGYILLADRLGATPQFSADEVRLFSSLAATLGSRLSTDRLLDQLEIQARTDPLTGLANRGAIEADLDRRISDGRTGAVLLLDLDRFKDVNDSLGHQFGDQLLRLVAERLDQHVRASDLAGRLGGDEFAIVIDRPESDDLAPQINGLTSRLTAPVNLDGVTLEIGSSIGVACWPDDATSSADLLRLADIAMYEAKRTHKRWIRYDPSIDHASADRLALLGQVRDAIANRELLIHLQPQVGTHGLELVGAEALLRWNHPDRGLVPPNEFIPLAEHSSLASSITQHVINEAIDAVTRLHGEDHELRIWVNLTARDLLDESLAPALAVSILRSGIAPERLGFEVTEGSLIINLETAIATLGALQRLGCGTAIDDFGTGYASLRYLQRLPISEVKIDRSFVANATTNPSSAAIVRSTTRLVQDLGMTVVAEGVEDQPTLDLLRRIGCDTVQGYFVSPPVDLDSFIAWAGQHGRRLAPAHTASDPDRRVHPDRRPAPPARERRVD